MTSEPRIPRGHADLYLAPVALAVDSWLEGIARLSGHDLSYRISLATNDEPRDSSERGQALTQAVTHEVEMHGWQVELAPRGLRLHHADHALVLGLPKNVSAYLAEA